MSGPKAPKVGGVAPESLAERLREGVRIGLDPDLLRLSAWVDDDPALAGQLGEMLRPFLDERRLAPTSFAVAHGFRAAIRAAAEELYSCADGQADPAIVLGPPERKHLLVRKKQAGATVERIAEELDVSPDTVKRILRTVVVEIAAHLHSRLLGLSASPASAL